MRLSSIGGGGRMRGASVRSASAQGSERTARRGPHGRARARVLPMNDRPNGVPIWVWGAAVALLLIVISSRGHLLAPENPALSEYFAAQPTPVGSDPSFELPQLD